MKLEKSEMMGIAAQLAAGAMPFFLENEKLNEVYTIADAIDSLFFTCIEVVEAAEILYDEDQEK